MARTVLKKAKLGTTRSFRSGLRGEGSRFLSTTFQPTHAITVVEICAAYWKHCQDYYVKNGKPTDEQAGIKAAMKRLKEEFGRLPVSELGPLKIKALQQRFVGDGVSRYYVNKSINRLKRMFRWAVSEELIPPSISQAIDSVTALKKGRTKAYELKPVPPVADAVVEKNDPLRCQPDYPWT